MKGRYPSQRALPLSKPVDNNTKRWWRPLTRWWGIVGTIIFVGLVIHLIEYSARWRTRPPSSFSTAQHNTPRPAMRLDAPPFGPRP
jgi:hypothetical protein